MKITLFLLLISGMMMYLPCSAAPVTTAEYINTANPKQTAEGPVLELHSKFNALAGALKNNQFNRPLVIESNELSSQLKGEIYAVVDYPYTKVSLELNNSKHWCDVLLLHINTKYCHAQAGTDENILLVKVGKKSPEDLDDVAQIDFRYTMLASTPEYFQIQLNAEKGPLGTSAYLISLEAISIPDKKTFLHLSYSYSMNAVARLALLTYLKTIASDKVGFTVTGSDGNGQLLYVDGVRGMIERNTMRYYLAIDSYLAVFSAIPAVAPAAQMEYRLNHWFAATEQYSQQLHEMNQADYLSMKRAEYIRQRELR